MAIDKNRQDELEQEDKQCTDTTVSPRQLDRLGPDENLITEMIEHQCVDEGVEADENNGDGGTLAQLKKGATASEVCRICGKTNDHRTSKCPCKDLAIANKRPIGKPTGPETAACSKGSGDSLAQQKKGAAVIKACRSCGKKNDHRTSKCPYKELAIANKRPIGKATGPEAAAACSKGSGDSLIDQIKVALANKRPFGKPTGPEAAAACSKDTGDSLAQQGNETAVFMICRSCGEKNDQYTSKCPHQNLAAPVQAFIDKLTAHQAACSSKDSNAPPSMRAVVETPVSEMPIQHRNDENSVMFTDLFDDTGESDLLELCRIFGEVSGAYIPRDQKTGMSQGFGIVNFVNNKDAVQAIKNLNGYYYGLLLLQVDWATPRTT